jgi:hypothetical protein
MSQEQDEAWIRQLIHEHVMAERKEAAKLKARAFGGWFVLASLLSLTLAFLLPLSPHASWLIGGLVWFGAMSLACEWFRW